MPGSAKAPGGIMSQRLKEPAAVLPEGLDAYKRTPVFTEATVPAGLLRDHRTKEGVWGLIQVVEGELLYRIDDRRRAYREYRVAPGTPGVVEPGVLHRVEPRGPVRFYVEFFRKGAVPRDSL
jgi:tellurite resistance-related uncharacterized protein